MNGGFIHEPVLLGRMECQARSFSARTRRQVRTPSGYVDLLIEWKQGSLAVEAELTTKRIGNDVAKAAELGVDELWIVVPNCRVADAVRRKLQRVGPGPGGTGNFVFTLGQAVSRLTDCFPLFSGSMRTEENNKQIRRRSAQQL